MNLMNKENKTKFFLEDLSLRSEYEFFEEGKENDELKEVATKRGIQIPSKDIAMFKCRYAMVDSANKNHCTLPRKEVKKALKTLNGKAIDKDHLRRSTIGVWLDAELEDDEIYAYGLFWKSNFGEEYADVKGRMLEGKAKISFEAWGERKFHEDGKNYDLQDIEFAGGAILFDTDPAFEDAEIMEMSSNRILEFAKVIEEEPKVEKDKVNMEEAKLNFNYDNEMIARLMWEGKCTSCETQGWFDVNSINFDNDEVDVTCGKCGGKSKMKLTPQMTLTKKGKKVEKSSTTQPEAEASEKITDKGGCEVDEFLKKYNMASIADMTKFVDEMSSSLVSKEKEIADLKKSVEDASLKIENSKIEIEKVQVEAKTVKDQLDAKLAAEKASFVKARKDELGEEFAKDLTDEDICNDLKFENAKLKKELATVKKVQETASTKTEGMEAGTKTAVTKDPLFTKQENIQSKAFPKES
jgi:hypothetical protein